MSLPDKKIICEQNIEVESIAKFLSKPIKEKIEIEARDLNIMRNRKSKLKFG